MKSILEESGYWAGYDYVSNPAGGFWGLWYGDDNIGIVDNNGFKASLYLQVESKWNYDTEHYDIRICLKLEDKNEEKDDRVRQLAGIILDNQGKCGFERPSRIRFGKHTTIGIYNSSFNDYNGFKDSIISSIDSLRQLSIETKKKLQSI